MLELTKTNKYDLLILDEVFCALDLNLLYQYQYFYFLKEKPKKLEVISTGRVIDKALMRKITDASDLHTDAYMVKHYMNRKCPVCKHTWKWSDNYCSYCGEQLPAPVFARKGIEL
jgi:ATP:corrinoid adenosyltransferase